MKQTTTTDTIKELKELWRNRNDDGDLDTSYEEFEDLLLSAISKTREDIADKLSKLPFHPEIEHYDGGTSERQVTYTTDIVALENSLKEKQTKV